MTFDFNDMIIGIGMIVHLLKNDYFIIILRSKITFKFGIPLTLKSMNWKSSTLKFNGWLSMGSTKALSVNLLMKVSLKIARFRPIIESPPFIEIDVITTNSRVIDHIFRFDKITLLLKMRILKTL